jgi:hypothetical protein
LQFHFGPAHFADSFDDVGGQTDRLGLVRQCGHDGLFDPPRSVSGKFGALVRVEAFDSLHQADVAFANQVQQGKTQVLVIARNLDHQPEVGGDHLFARPLIVPLDTSGQFEFFFPREQFDLSNLAKIQLQCIAVPGFRRRGSLSRRSNGGFGRSLRNTPPPQRTRRCQRTSRGWHPRFSFAFTSISLHIRLLSIVDYMV